MDPQGSEWNQFFGGDGWGDCTKVLHFVCSHTMLSQAWLLIFRISNSRPVKLCETTLPHHYQSESASCLGLKSYRPHLPLAFQRSSTQRQYQILGIYYPSTILLRWRWTPTTWRLWAMRFARTSISLCPDVASCHKSSFDFRKATTCIPLVFRKTTHPNYLLSLTVW